MRFLLLATTVVALVFATGCTSIFQTVKGSGVAATEVRTVDEFSKISIGGTSEVTVTVGDEQSVTVTFDDNLLELVRTEVSNGELQISTKGNYSTSVGMKVEISVPTLDEASVSGIGQLNVEGVIGPKFKLDVSGVGSAQIFGNVDQLDVSVSGTAKAKLKDLKSKSVDVNTSGTSSAEVFATESADADASGTSTIEVFGNPTSVSHDTSGVANIEIVK